MNKRKSLNESDTGCQNETTPIIYKFETESLVWETNPENYRQKIPVVKDMTYFLVGELQ